MTGLHNTPIESPHYTGPLPESLYTSHDSNNSYPEVCQKPQRYESYPEVVPDGQKERVRNDLDTAPQRFQAPGAVSGKKSARICGLRKKVFLITLAAALLAVAAIVGGVTGGILGTRNKSGSKQDISTASPPVPTDLNGTTTGANNTVKAPTPIRHIAASEDNRTIFTVWQKPNGGLFLHGWYETPGIWAAPFEINLINRPIDNTPLALLTWQWEDYFEIRVTYSTQNGSALGRIRFQCYENGTLCTEPSDVLKDDLPAPVAGAGVANIRTHDYYERLYYVGNDTFIQESRYLMDNNSWTEPAPISTAAAAHLASPIGVTMVDEEIWLFWFADDKQLQYATSTNNGSEWSTVHNISLTTLPAYLPRSLSVVRSNSPASTQLFFLDDVTVRRAQFSNNRWSADHLHASMPDSLAPNGPLAAVGWNGPATRLYFLVDDNDNDSFDSRLREVAGESLDGEWVMGAMPGDVYGISNWIEP